MEPTIETLTRVFPWASEEKLQEILDKKLYLYIDYGYDPDECLACGS